MVMGSSAMPLSESPKGGRDEKTLIQPYQDRRMAAGAITSNVLAVLTDRNFCQVRREDWGQGPAKRLYKQLFDTIKARVENDEPILFATLYGVSSKGHPDERDEKFLDVIHENTVERVKHFYPTGSKVTFIIATPHAAMNGVDRELRDNYASELKGLMESGRYGDDFRVDFLRPLWNQHGVSEEMFLRIGKMVYEAGDDPSAIKKHRGEIIAEVLSNIERLWPSASQGVVSHAATPAQLAEEHVKRYFTNIRSLILKFKQYRETVLRQSQHNNPEGLVGEDAEIKARAYWLMRNCETNILSSAYPSSIFLTTSRLPLKIYPPLTLRFWPERYRIWHPWAANAPQIEAPIQAQPKTNPS
jgi:hypothetical protein